jgi:hypothetical protein
MNPLVRGLAEAHMADLHREAAEARSRVAGKKAALEDRAGWMPAVTFRLGTPVDQPAIEELAALDSSVVPRAPLMLAEVAGELRAAVSLEDGTVIADPFHPTAPLVRLLLTWTEHLDGQPPNGLRRVRQALRPDPRGHSRSGFLVQPR